MRIALAALLVLLGACRHAGPPATEVPINNAAPQLPTPFLYDLNWIWRYPRTGTYVTCGTPEADGADFCLPAGEWTAVCESMSATDKDVRAHARSATTFVTGPIVNTGGMIRVEGCGSPQLLLPGRIDVPTHATATRRGTPLFAPIEFDFGEEVWKVSIAELPNLIVSIAPKDKPYKRVARPTYDITPDLRYLYARPKAFLLRVVGDVDNDAAPELVVLAQDTGVTREYETVEYHAGLLYSLASPRPRLIGWTVNHPRRPFPREACGPATFDCEVMDYLEQRQNCEFWMSETPKYEGASEAEIAKAREGCDRLPAWRRALREKHAADPRALRAIRSVD